MRAKTPELKQKRLKMFIYGPAGVGKTMATIQFPKAVIIDTEKGTDQYHKSIINAGSVVFQSNDPEEIVEEIEGLLTKKHEYTTLVLDPVTQIYNAIQEKWTRTFEKYATTEKEKDVQDFGVRFWGKVKAQYKRMQRLLTKLDMNVIATSHQKDVYGTGFSKIGTTYDSMKGEDYFFDLVFQIEKQGAIRTCKTIKERSEIGMNRFPPEFAWSYENFCEFYGKDILEKESTPIAMAAPEQVEKLEKLVKVMNVDNEIVTKWLTKADVDSYAEMTGDQIQKCIDFVEKQLSELNAAQPVSNGKQSNEVIKGKK